MAKRKKKPAEPAPEAEAQKWLTLEEAATADRERHVDGVLVELGPRFSDVGICKLRIVSHDSSSMKEEIAAARRRSIDRHNASLPAGEHLFSAETVCSGCHKTTIMLLPPDLQRRFELEVAVASLRGGDGVELHGDLVGDSEPWSTEGMQSHFLVRLEDAPAWIIKGIYRAGASIVGSPFHISDREILELRKKGSARGLQAELALIGGEAEDALGSLGGLLSRAVLSQNAARGSQSTTPPPPAQTTSKPSKSTT